MAKRYVYVPNTSCLGVTEKEIEFKWFPGFAVTQKQKSVRALHTEALIKGINSILEISSKSEIETGIQSSAFNLYFKRKNSQTEVSVESAFQGSKKFEFSGPFPDLYNMSARDAKKEIRLRQQGKLTKFTFFRKDFPIIPITFFYDWLYINTLVKNPTLAEGILNYDAFSDIEFNPEKSINCQAYSAALYVSLVKNNLINDALESETSFKKILKEVYEERQKTQIFQLNIF
ncbi:MAG: hypothetical protein COC24_013110 [Alphaproteobacteria bacterium]|nr:hypothetical protein [Alphaproteobacteria bacterium]